MAIAVCRANGRPSWLRELSSSSGREETKLEHLLQRDLCSALKLN